MGTKHNYTEKECKVCHVVKTRAEFPTYGGRTCRDCMRKKEAAAQQDRYQRDKQNPEWVRKNREKAREYYERKRQNVSGNDDGESNTNDPPAEDVESMSVDEFMESLGRVEHDEDLVDLTGSGIDVEIPGDSQEQSLSDMLSTWRDDVGSKPVPKFEKVEQAMSVAENAQRIRLIATKTEVMGMVQQALLTLNEDQATAISAADSTGASEDAQKINGAFEAAKEALSTAIGMVQAAYGAAGDVASKHGA